MVPKATQTFGSEARLACQPDIRSRSGFSLTHNRRTHSTMAPKASQTFGFEARLAYQPYIRSRSGFSLTHNRRTHSTMAGSGDIIHNSAWTSAFLRRAFSSAAFPWGRVPVVSESCPGLFRGSPETPRLPVAGRGSRENEACTLCLTMVRSLARAVAPNE
jgi:hypothetical protein